MFDRSISVPTVRSVPAMLLLAHCFTLPDSRSSAAEPERELSVGIRVEAIKKEFEQRLKKKFRPVDLCTYIVGPRMAASIVWEKQLRGDFRIHYGFNRDEMKKQITEYGGQGYHLVNLTAAAGSRELYGGLWEKRGEGGQEIIVRYGFPAAEALKLERKLSGEGAMIVGVAPVTVARGVTFALAWEKRAKSVREFDLTLTESAFLRAFRKRRMDGFRLKHTHAYFDGRIARFACIWEKAAGAEQLVRPRMSRNGLQKANKQLVGKGYRPALVTVCLVRGRERYTAVWEK